MESESVDSSNQTENIIRLSLSVPSDHAGIRFDHFLVLQFPSLSRSQLSSSIKDGSVLINGVQAKASRKLRAGDIVSGYIHENIGITPVPQKVNFSVLHEDEHLILLSKPPGLVVHPASGNPDKTLVNGLLYHCASIAEVGDPIRPGIVHRLDKDTSGIMVIAKNNSTHRQLVEAFKERAVTKKYTAIVCGIPGEPAGRIVAPIGRHPVSRKKMAIREMTGKFAATRWTLRKKLGEHHALVQVVIETGRTHQIRVHMASIGHPVGGDDTYGFRKANLQFPRHMLHSAELSFTHPVTGENIRGKAPLWADMVDAITRLEIPGV